jgi:hypothetical protein
MPMDTRRCESAPNFNSAAGSRPTAETLSPSRSTGEGCDAVLSNSVNAIRFLPASNIERIGLASSIPHPIPWLRFLQSKLSQAFVAARFSSLSGPAQVIASPIGRAARRPASNIGNSVCRFFDASNPRPIASI